MRQINHQKVDLALNTINNSQSLTKICLSVARCMVKRHKHLAGALTNFLNVVLYNGISAIKPMLYLQSLKYPLGCMALLAVSGAQLSFRKLRRVLPPNAGGYCRRARSAWGTRFFKNSHPAILMTSCDS
jgi:hypothetical protein